MYEIDKIKLDPGKFKHYQIKGSIEKIQSNLSRINILIGANNSGKSRFLRNLLVVDNINYSPTSSIYNDFKEKLNLLPQSLDKIFKENGFQDGGSASHELLYKLINKNDFLVEGTGLTEDLREFIVNVIGENINGLTRMPSYHHGNPQLAISRASTEFRESDMLNLYDKTQSIVSKKFKRLYIPTLRGLRPINSDTQGGTFIEFNNDDVYGKRTAADYFVEKKKNAKHGLLLQDKYEEQFSSSIFTGLNFYAQIQELLLGDAEQRELVREFEIFIKEKFFQKESSFSIIPKLKDDVVNVKIGNDEYPIYHLGDGIQSIIILTFPLFVNKHAPLLVFIEEPEINLHPGMQRMLVETFLDDKLFSNHQFFLTTHSNHFLDLTMDFEHISIYTFKKHIKNDQKELTDEIFTVENVQNDNLNTLDLIGVRNSSIFLSNCTIWVEGITDRLYLRKYIELFYEANPNKKKFKEDFHFSFLEYGGNNITHYSFLNEFDFESETIEKRINYKKICNKIFLIADRDFGKEERFEILQKNLSGNFYLLKGREIENILSPQTIINVVSSYERIGTERLPNIFHKINHKDYLSEPLGEFIENAFANETKNRIGSYSKGGTVSDKVNFCRKAVDLMASYDDLSEYAKELTVKLYEFIESNN